MRLPIGYCVKILGEEPDENTIINEILDKANITLEQAEEAAIIIQNAFRQFKKREELAHDLLKGMVDWRVAARSTLRLYRKTGVTYEEANRAATLIKVLLLSILKILINIILCRLHTKVTTHVVS